MGRACGGATVFHGGVIAIVVISVISVHAHSESVMNRRQYGSTQNTSVFPTELSSALPARPKNFQRHRAGKHVHGQFS